VNGEGVEENRRKITVIPFKERGGVQEVIGNLQKGAIISEELRGRLLRTKETPLSRRVQKNYEKGLKGGSQHSKKKKVSKLSYFEIMQVSRWEGSQREGKGKRRKGNAKRDVWGNSHYCVEKKKLDWTTTNVRRKKSTTQKKVKGTCKKDKGEK